MYLCICVFINVYVCVLIWCFSHFFFSFCLWLSLLCAKPPHHQFTILHCICLSNCSDANVAFAIRHGRTTPPSAHFALLTESGIIFIEVAQMILCMDLVCRDVSLDLCFYLTHLTNWQYAIFNVVDKALKTYLFLCLNLTSTLNGRLLIFVVDFAITTFPVRR